MGDGKDEPGLNEMRLRRRRFRLWSDIKIKLLLDAVDYAIYWLGPSH
jgi:hypothetical protein